MDQDLASEQVLERTSEVVWALASVVQFAEGLVSSELSLHYFWYAALTNVSVAAGTAIFNCSPLFVYCFSICFLHERLSFGKICGVMTSFVGVTLVVMFQDGNDVDEMAGTSLLAGLLVVISAALYGGYEVALRLAVGEDITDTSTLLTMTGLTGLFTIPLWIVGSFVLAYCPFPSLQEPLGFPVSGNGVFLLLLSGMMAVVFNVFLPLSLCWTSPLETSVVLLPLIVGFFWFRGGDDPFASFNFVDVLGRHSVIPLAKLWKIAAFLSTFYCVTDYFWYSALANVSVAAGTAIFNCSPLFVYCFSICFLHERLSLGKMCGVLTSFVGVTLVVMFQNGSGLDDIASTGVVAGLMVVLSAALYGGYEVAIRLMVGEDITDTPR
ncbi:Hypothetical protein PHPALM_16862 [Phytophthora palmivora]|uniref:EamA domain-containing protein n=1 Tax=Phytophthora palmivora TaxID=4796 RepID=A0A2P4XNQ0_9STRA|nr:Hypothetical protein PHPALM_16862 [Phytophthora palmivora]